MTDIEIRNIIQQELAHKPDLTNGHGVKVDQCLIEPILQSYLDSFNENEILKLWTVLEETPDGNGYKIVFDPDNKIFGLGIMTNKNELMYLGAYGTFSETLRSM